MGNLTDLTPHSTNSPDAFQQGERYRHGRALPEHIPCPEHELYRTPTAEDSGRDCGDSTEQQCHDECFGRPQSHSHLYSPTMLRDHLPSRDSFVPHALLEKKEWRERIRHFTWTFFTMTMATGGIANVLYAVPFRFPGLTTIGTIFFLFNVVLFLFNVVMISLRFHLYPETFKASFLHPTESLFVPASVVSFGTILINISQYGLHKTGPWLNTTVCVFFWIDVALAFVASFGIYLLMWSTQTHTIQQMTPIWIFPAYPLLIIGPHAGILSSQLRQSRALDIIIGGFTAQGIGFMVSLMIYSAYLARLMTRKLPQESLRPGMFVSIGPCGFTVSGIINMAANAQRALPEDFMGDGRTAAMILKVVGNFMSIWLWGLAIWFLFVSVGAHLSWLTHKRTPFAMTWYSFVFPNTALVTATFAIGKAFGSKVIQVVGCVLTVILIIVWIFVFVMMIRAIVLKQILWPQKGEDKDEGGWKATMKSDHPQNDGFTQNKQDGPAGEDV